MFGVAFDPQMKDEVQVTLIATGFNGGPNNQTSFFSSEAATNVAANNLQRGAAATEAARPQTSTNPFPTAQQNPAMDNRSPVDGGSISGTLSVDEDPSIPPFLRKMRG